MPSLPPAIDLNVRTRGEGALVVGVHDLLGSGQAVMRALRPLSTHGYRVMAPDLRGHGTSPTPEGPWSIDVEWSAPDELKIQVHVRIGAHRPVVAAHWGSIKINATID